MRKQFFDAFNKWLSLDDTVHLDVGMATALASQFPGDPVWIMLVGVPGSGKTEFVRALNGPYVYSIDTLTPRTLVSGFKERGRTQANGILQDLDGKILVIKDLTVMLENNRYGEDNVFNQLRAAYDGEYSAAHGSGLKKQTYKTQFGLVAAVTPVIDRYRAISTTLGERFITIRIVHNSNKAIDRAQKNTGHESEMREELQNVTRETISYYRKIGLEAGIPQLSDIDIEKIKKLSRIVAKARTEVPRDHKHMVIAIPEPEIGTRQSKQFTKLGEMMKLFSGYDYVKITRVARDSINPTRLKIVKKLFDVYRANPWEIHVNSGTPYATTKEVMEDMWLVGLCDKEEKGQTGIYTFNDEIMELLMETEFLGQQD